MSNDVSALMETHPGEATTDVEKEEFWRRSDELMKKIKTYAVFAPEDSEVSFDGYCRYCYEQVPMRIENGRVWISCTTCAATLADSVS